MGIAYNPKIATDGLVTCIDAANLKSYNPNLMTTLGAFNYSFNNQSLPTELDVAPDVSTVLCRHNLTGAASPFMNARANRTLTPGVYTMSAWVRATTAFSASFAYVGETTNEIYSNTASVTTSWTRFTLTFTLAAQQTASRLQIFFGTQGNDKIISVWGAELVKGSTSSAYYINSDDRGVTWYDSLNRSNALTVYGLPTFNAKKPFPLQYNGVATDFLIADLSRYGILLDSATERFSSLDGFSHTIVSRERISSFVGNENYRSFQIETFNIPSTGFLQTAGWVGSPRGVQATSITAVSNAVECITLGNDQTTQFAMQNSYAIPTAAVTFSCWFRSNFTSAAQTPFTYSVGGNNEMLFFINSATQIAPHDIGNAAAINVPNMQNRWCNFTWTRVSATGVSVYYLDGVQVGTRTYLPGTSPVSGGYLIIGQESDTPGGGFDANQNLDGDFARLDIYNRAITAAEVAQNYAALRGRFGI